MDSSYLAPTTELDAVNDMLGVIGESPISSLEGTLPADAYTAMQILGRVSREVQSRGWHFNTEEAVPLTPDESNYINIPSNVVSIDANKVYHPTLDVVKRGTKLYNRENHSFDFSDYTTVYCDITYLLEFTDMPEAARRYISIRAARIFQDKFMGSDTLHGFSQEDEMWAKIDLENEEAASADYNILHGIPAFVRRATTWH